MLNCFGRICLRLALLALAFSLSGCTDSGGDVNDLGSDQSTALSDPNHSADWPRVANEAHIKSTVTDGFRGFGHSVSLSLDGNTLAVSAIPNFLRDSASVETFNKDASGQWVSQGLVNDSVSRTFGQVVKLSQQGNRLLIADDGATMPDYRDAYGYHSGVAAGRVMVADRSDTGIWNHVVTKSAPNRRDIDHFGESIDISADGRVFAVGAPGRDFETLPDNPDGLVKVDNSGSVFVFSESTPGQFDLIQQLRAPYPAVNHGFGTTLAMSDDGSTLVVLSPGDDSGGAGVIPNEALTVSISANSGVLHVYKADASGQFVLDANLKSSLVDENPEHTGSYDFQEFGRYLAIGADGNTIVAGATYSIYNASLIWPPPEAIIDIDRGEVTVFQRDNSQWRVNQLIKAPAADRQSSEFGADVVLSSDAQVLAVGMSGFSEYPQDGDFDAGAVFTYHRNADGLYEPFRSVRLPIAQRGELLGKALSISADGRWLVSGASKESSGGFGVDPPINAQPVEANSGAVYIHDMSRADTE